MIIGIYFSPTGGTRAIADHACHTLSQHLGTPYRLQSYTLPAERENRQPIATNDIVVWASPVYAGRVPNKTLDFIGQLMRGSGNKGIAIAVFGNRNYDNALAEMCQLMAEAYITPVAAAAMVSRHAFAPTEIATGRPNEHDYAEMDAWLTHIDWEKTAQVPGSTANGYYQPLKADGTPANFLKAKPVLNESRCMLCAKCKRACPMGSIEITYKGPEFHGLCIKCQACIVRCPEQALSFADEDLASHVEMLRKNYATPSKENKFF